MTTHRLPAQPAPLIGRTDDLAAARRYLAAAETRLLTFTGPGGAGKTRLAVEVAASLAEEFDDGATFVDLAPVGEAGLVAAAIAQALGVVETGREAPAQRVQRALGERHLLLLLDNFEHVTGAAPLVADLLAACPNLTVLATSRVPLNLRWEQVFVVPPLVVPDPSRLPAPDALSAVPAVALFVNRARAVKPDFVLDESNARAVAEVCVRLDGLPLAIQLAASRSRMFSPQAMLARLQRGLDALSEGARDLPARHRTLRDTMAWSYNLLAPPEQTLFRRLGVFAGGCTPDAAEAVCGDSGSPPKSKMDVLAGLETLLDHSLVRQEVAPDGEPRFTMLETIREYALERLATDDEAEATRGRHAAWYLGLTERAEPEVHGPRESEWLNRLALEHDNLRQALQWLVGREAAEGALRLAGALWPFWEVRGYWTEGRERLAATLALPETHSLPHQRAKVLFGAGTLARRQGDYAVARALYAECLALWRSLRDQGGMARVLFATGAVVGQGGERQAAQSLFEDSLTIAREVGDKRTAADALDMLGIASAKQGDYPEARRLLEESLALRREVEDRRGVANSLLNLGNVLRRQGDRITAHDRYEESLRLFRDLDSKLGLAIAATNLGQLAYYEGDLDPAQAFFDESLQLGRAMGDRAGMARSLANLGMVALARGDLAAARDLYNQSLTLRRELQSKEGIAVSLEGLAGVAGAQSQPQRALRLVAAAARLREDAGVMLSPDERAALQQKLDAARQATGKQAGEAAWAQGRAMAAEQAVAYALALDEAEEPSLPAANQIAPLPRPPLRRAAGSESTPLAELTAREREVALLVAQGCTNRQIAERLVVTTGTAAIHVEHIRNKLGFHSRAQIASWVAAQGWAADT